MIASCCYVAQSYSIGIFIISHSQVVLRDIFWGHIASPEFYVEALISLASIDEDDETDLYQPSDANCDRLSLFSQSINQNFY